MRLDDFVEREVSDGTDSDYYARWSPDGNTIALERNIGSLVTVDENGGSPHLIDSVSTGLISYPIWSPDGTTIVYAASVTSSQQELRSAVATGTSHVSLTPGADGEGPLDWSPDGSRILFESNRTGNYDVFTIDPSGGSLKNVTNQSGDDGKDGAHWSPDSTKIAFTGSSHVCTINADGTGEMNLTGTSTVAEFPFWASTNVIYYSIGNTTVEQLFSMLGNGGNQHSIEDNTANDANPILSPDKTKLAWLSDRQTSNGQMEVWVANPDGSSPARATNGTHTVNLVSWRPCHRP